MRRKFNRNVNSTVTFPVFCPLHSLKLRSEKTHTYTRHYYFTCAYMPVCSTRRGELFATLTVAMLKKAAAASAAHRVSSRRRGKQAPPSVPRPPSVRPSARSHSHGPWVAAAAAAATVGPASFFCYCSGARRSLPRRRRWRRRSRVQRRRGRVAAF